MVVEISDWNDLDNVRNDLTGDYVLVNDLDSGTEGYTGIGDDFEPIGFIENDDFTSEFAGSFDGDGFSISDVVIAYDNVDGDIGLFASTDTGALIENLSVDGSVTVTNSGSFNYAGLVGNHDGGSIQNCVSHVDVTALDGDLVGGLVGGNADTVTESYATGSVEGNDRVGGLAGRNTDTITKSYATGSVDGDSTVGGLVGRVANAGTVSESFATGAVNGGGDSVGGLVGNDLFGPNDISNSYADSETTSQNVAVGDNDDDEYTNVTTLTTAEMQGSEAETNMNGFDFANVWSTVVGDETETINGQITLDDVAVETATVILHNFSEPESTEVQGDGYPILLSVDEDEQLESQDSVVRNIGRTETDTDGNYSADIPGATGDTIAVAVDFDDGTERYGRLVTTVLE